MNGWMIGHMKGRIYMLKVFKNESMIGWMNEWTNEWINECINKCMNESINQPIIQAIDE